MTELLFIRHAETNMAGTFCGHSDPELNPRGRVQLVELLDRFRAEDIGAVYSSDLRRAHAIGVAVAEAFNIDCHARRGLREISFGRWEGLKWKEIEQQNGAYAQRWVDEYPNLPAPDGENFADFERRVLEEVTFMSRESERIARDIVVITHAGVLRTVLRALHGSSEEDAWNRTRLYCTILRHPVIARSHSLRQAEVTL